MIKKVVLPRKVAEAIEKVWHNYDSPHFKKHLVLNNWCLLEQEYSETHDILKNYCGDNPIEYMTALVNGYTVEQTKEERLLEYYEKCLKAKANNNQYDLQLGAIQGINKTLEILGIPITGINEIRRKQNDSRTTKEV